ncbi:aldo/keto reductase [Acidobacteria bacterium AH-259-L09]|nr:aldo/keto reductase [Acidobacteria bacterium AH-259-L09]
MSETTRREFVGNTLGAAAAASLGRWVLAQTRPSPAGIPTRPLGKTGEKVSILCLGGWHIGAVKDPQETIRIMHAAMDQGITFFDNAWDYHDGWSEEIMGRALAMDTRRQKVFLMTKNCERDYQGSMRNLEESLRRLQTDYLDLWQFHEMVYDNDPDWVFEKRGIKAAIEAQKAGKVRYIGFTGHKDPRIHLKMLGKPFAWDAAQMPINVMDFHYRSFQNEVVPVCLEKGVGVLGMKSLGGGYPKGRIPATTGVSAQECLRYALGLPISSLVVGITSMKDLEQDLEVARNFESMKATEQKRLLAQVKDVATDGRHELFKSAKNFDGPHHRRQHGFATD